MKDTPVTTPAPADVTAADGQRLAVRLFLPDAPRGVVVIHSATAVPQGFYAGFAGALADRGLAVVSYDYRGTGLSRPARLRGFRASKTDWINLDAEAITEWAHTRWPDLPLMAVGHSVGAHAIALGAASRHLRAAAMVATHLAYAHDIEDRAERWKVLAMTRLAMPALVGLFGYLPGRSLGLGEDLPAGVVRQWIRWTRLPGYFFDDPAIDAQARFARLRVPVLAIGVDDDPWSTRRALDRLTARLIAAQVQRVQIAPEPDARIGHIGFFKPRHGAHCWPVLLDWLEAQADAS